MKTFISDTLDSILKAHPSFENTTLILPSQRAGVFVKQTLKQKTKNTFLPEIISIEQFIASVSGMTSMDTVQLLFHFYKVYCGIEEQPESFETFASWAQTALQDFNEMDQHLIDTKAMFQYLKDVQRMREWTMEAPIEETTLMKDHFSFMKKLGGYHKALYAYLKEKKTGYQGMLYREATENMTAFAEKNKNRHFIFIGFNALNKSEELICQELLAQGNTTMYWDIDAAFLNNQHQAGFFVRKYQSEWPYLEKNPIQASSNEFRQAKHIELIGAPKNTTQLKEAGRILSKLESFENTAMVLGDEAILPIALNSLPKKVEAVNITMGYSLKDIPITALFEAIFQLYLTQDRLQKKTENTFYYKDVLRFLSHPSIQRITQESEHNISNAIGKEIAKDNQVFLTKEQISSYFESIEADVKEGILPFFEGFKNTSLLITLMLNLIDLLKENTSVLEREYLFRYHTLCTQLHNLQKQFQYITQLQTLHKLFRQLSSSETLSFRGEPLKGLQLMGLLETRVLDFENLILTSINEGILPKAAAGNSFIPFDAKLSFGLPTQKEKDAIFSYHFFRLLQRAKKIYILYNTESDSLGGGEKSRYLSQLMLLRKDINQHLVSPKIHPTKETVKQIEKSPAVLEKIKAFATKGISPSSLTNYLYNPYEFYKQKILGISSLDQVEETVADNTMGTIVHDTLDALYTPFKGAYLTVKDIDGMYNKIDALTQTYFKEHFSKSSKLVGRNKLVFEVAKRFVERFLDMEKEVVKSHQLKIIATEAKLATEITLDGFDFPIKFKGTVDRIDELDGQLRIIDYKTGSVSANELKNIDFSTLKDSYKYNKAIQIMLYAFLYSQQKNTDSKRPIHAGIISFKNLKSGLLSMNFSEKRNGTDYNITKEILEDYMNGITALIQEIFDPTLPFIEKINEKNT